MTASLLVLAVAAVLLAGHAQAQTAPTQNTLSDAKIQTTSCLAGYNAIIRNFYATDAECSALVTRALNTTVKAQCPPTTVGSPVHRCMNKNGTVAVTDAWSSWVRGCEIMYIANRGGSGESEEGFKYVENSCFPIFNSFSDFVRWLTDASPYGGVQATLAASSLHVSLASMLATVLLAALLAVFGL